MTSSISNHEITTSNWRLGAEGAEKMVLYLARDSTRLDLILFISTSFLDPGLTTKPVNPL